MKGGLFFRTFFGELGRAAPSPICGKQLCIFGGNIPPLHKKIRKIVFDRGGQRVRYIKKHLIYQGAEGQKELKSFNENLDLV